MPIDPLTDLYRGVSTFRDLPDSLLGQIAHFFEHYKDLEPGKWVKVQRWGEAEEAMELIRQAIERANAEREADKVSRYGAFNPDETTE